MSRRTAGLVRQHGLALVAATFLLVAVVSGFLAPAIAPFRVSNIDVDNILRPPSAAFPFGTDDFGHSVLTRVLHGTTNTIGMAGASVLVASTCGAFLGLVAGYVRGWPETVIMRVADLLLSFPGLLLALTLVTFVGPSAGAIIVILGITHLPRYLRLIRGVILTLREREFVHAARSVGASHARIIRRHLLPNAVAPVIVYSTLDLGFSISVVAGMSFLGFGLAPPAQSWGQLLAQGRPYAAQAPWIATFAGLAIALSVLSFNVIGDSLRDALDPKLRRS